MFSGTKITFNAVDPGLVRGTGHIEKYSTLGRSFVTKMSVLPWVWLFLKTPKQGCQSIVHLAVDPTLNNVSGCYFRYSHENIKFSLYFSKKLHI